MKVEDFLLLVIILIVSLTLLELIRTIKKTLNLIKAIASIHKHK